MAIETDQFKKTLQYWASGVTVVTTNSNTYGMQGMTVSAFSSVSADPPLILVCINRSVTTSDGIGESGVFAVNILGSDQSAVSNMFAGGGDHHERFASVSWEEGLSGSPLLNDSIASLDCKVVDKISAGTHWVIVGEVQQTVLREGDPLLYYKAGYRQLKSD